MSPTSTASLWSPPGRAILDGIERHLSGHLIDQAVHVARRTGLIRPSAVRAIQEARTDR